jgi:oligopeptide transport system permease protein
VLKKYILKRILIMFVTLFIISTITFILVNLIPGDPIGGRAKALPPETEQAIRKKYKLDKPLYVRYGYFLYDLVRGDMGVSIAKPGVRVNDMIKTKFPVSARLGLQAVLFGLIIGLLLGIIAAFKRSTWVDYLVIFISLLGISIPGFVMAVLLQQTLGGKMGIPFVGWTTSTSWLSGFKYTLLPTIALSFTGIASNARFMRTSVLDVINQDYILTAKAKGINKTSITYKHVLRNSIMPVVTILGPRIAGIITGTLVVESIFAIPGLGRELITAIGSRDYTVVMSLTVFFAFLYILSLLLVDIAYVFIDPRIKLDANKK